MVLLISNDYTTNYIPNYLLQTFLNLTPTFEKTPIPIQLLPKKVEEGNQIQICINFFPSLNSFFLDCIVHIKRKVGKSNHQKRYSPWNRIHLLLISKIPISHPTIENISNSKRFKPFSPASCSFALHHTFLSFLYQMDMSLNLLVFS